VYCRWIQGDSRPIWCAAGGYQEYCMWIQGEQSYVVLTGRYRVIAGQYCVLQVESVIAGQYGVLKLKYQVIASHYSVMQVDTG
jgi:hypothetical protein